MGIFSRKKTNEKGKGAPTGGSIEIEFFPLHRREGSMINAILEALQELSGLIMTSRLVERLAGTFFVLASLISGVALLITVMYLASPESFEKRLVQVLVEKPVVEGSAKEKKAETEGVAEEASEEAEAE